ncbi:MAG TPA: hypothetical protein VGX37_06105 [Allosphingosinicella sp.]|jgi:hypothetical protein|nr:hypothetical protein [Allosphingosinicella sp.]
MFWVVAIGGGLVSLALIVGGAAMLQRAKNRGGGSLPGIALLVIGFCVLLGTIVVSVIVNPTKPVGRTMHEVEVVSRNTVGGRGRFLNVALRNLESGETYNAALGRTIGNDRICLRRGRELHEGYRFTAPFIIWENENSHERSETPDEAELTRRFC